MDWFSIGKFTLFKMTNVCPISALAKVNDTMCSCWSVQRNRHCLETQTQRNLHRQFNLLDTSSRLHQITKWTRPLCLNVSPSQQPRWSTSTCQLPVLTQSPSIRECTRQFCSRRPTHQPRLAYPPTQLSPLLLHRCDVNTTRSAKAIRLQWVQLTTFKKIDGS